MSPYTVWDMWYLFLAGIFIVYVLLPVCIALLIRYALRPRRH